MATAESNGGAYRLYIRVPRPITVQVGRLGRHRLESGVYVYVGSARRGLRQRVARHGRLAVEKRGNRHWHIDAVLLHRATRLLRSDTVEEGDECALSAALAAQPGVEVPIARFGATDCHHGCAAHFYRLNDGEMV